MKNSIYLIIILFFLYGCNTDDNSGGSDDDGGGGSGSAMLVKKITHNYPDGSGSSEEVFHYQNNQLKAIVYSCYDIVRYFEYGSSNKVSDEYRFSYENFDIESFNIQEVINALDTNHIEYIYENNRLTSTKRNGNSNLTISYNNVGLIKNLVVIGYHTDSYIISYENNIISSVFHSDETGDSDVHTFNLDDKINPFYEIFRQYGIIGSDGCGDYYGYMFVADFPLFQNNIITEFVDSIPDESATYVYLENGLPEAVAFDTFHGRVSYFFSY